MLCIVIFNCFCQINETLFHKNCKLLVRWKEEKEKQEREAREAEEAKNKELNKETEFVAGDETTTKTRKKRIRRNTEESIFHLFFQNVQCNKLIK